MRYNIPVKDFGTGVRNEHIANSLAFCGKFRMRKIFLYGQLYNTPSENEELKFTIEIFYADASKFNVNSRCPQAKKFSAVHSKELTTEKSNPTNVSGRQDRYYA